MRRRVIHIIVAWIFAAVANAIQLGGRLIQKPFSWMLDQCNRHLRHLCKNSSPCVVVLVFVAALGGCAAPGAPLLRTTNQDADGPLVPGCKNVSSKAVVDRYITESYLTTWGSAWVEGATQGFFEGIDEIELKKNPTKRPSEKLNNLPLDSQSFCRTYQHSTLSVSRAVAKVLPLLGNKVAASNIEFGFFRTKDIERQHKAARWRDRYDIQVTKFDSHWTSLSIKRVIYISRDGTTFNEAISVGYNEAWIMKKVNEILMQNSH